MKKTIVTISLFLSLTGCVVNRPIVHVVHCDCTQHAVTIEPEQEPPTAFQKAFKAVKGAVDKGGKYLPWAFLIIVLG